MLTAEQIAEIEDRAPDPKCTNAHDRCFGGAGGPCPYCERSPRKALIDWRKLESLCRLARLGLEMEKADATDA